MKDSMGFVHFQGAVVHQSTAQSIVQLPQGYRPEITIDFNAYDGGKGSVWSNGNVYIWSGAGSEKNFNHLTYKAVE